MKFKSWLLIIFILLNVTTIKADENVNLLLPSLTYEEAINYAMGILGKLSKDDKNYEIQNITYNYITGEWAFSITEKGGPYFYFFINDKDPTKYRSVGGA